MSLGSKFEKIDAQIQSIQKLKIERAQRAATQILHSDQFSMSILASPDAKIAVDAIVNNVARAVSNPVDDYLDTISMKGFNKPETRELTHRLYILYCQQMGGSSHENLTYEEMLEPVARYCYAHQEVYSSISPEMLRS